MNTFAPDWYVTSLTLVFRWRCSNNILGCLLEKAITDLIAPNSFYTPPIWYDQALIKWSDTLLDHLSHIFLWCRNLVSSRIWKKTVRYECVRNVKITNNKHLHSLKASDWYKTWVRSLEFFIMLLSLHYGQRRQFGAYYLWPDSRKDKWRKFTYEIGWWHREQAATNRHIRHWTGANWGKLSMKFLL